MESNEKNKHSNKTDPAWIVLLIVALIILLSPSQEAKAQTVDITPDDLISYGALRDGQDIPALRANLSEETLRKVAFYHIGPDGTLALTAIPCGTGRGAFLVTPSNDVAIGCYVVQDGLAEVVMHTGQNFLVGSSSLKLTKFGFRIALFGVVE
ncbi:hypothetical protein HOV04_gp80 [Xanthomonas phage XcP1]|uniref:Uncharacterized protein n=1 Tax=Xanthomonas phage XcP1 TaxID=2785027 RepID=A0A3S7L8Q1_9CAUD|nr:hypothetical protein HOV04_gp80 [Xanthomonas phage XcP1]AWN08582.1 hypothetical protein XcP1_080 [Xanthomonas phage XcP1]